MKMRISVKILLLVIFCGIVHGTPSSPSIALDSRLLKRNLLRSQSADWRECNRSCLNKKSKGEATYYFTEKKLMTCMKSCCYSLHYTTSSHRGSSSSRLISKHQDLMSSVRGFEEKSLGYPLAAQWNQCLQSYPPANDQRFSACCNRPPLANYTI